MDQGSMQDYVDRMPWPEGKKPVLKLGIGPRGGFMVLLHESCKNGWHDVAQIEAPTPEAALRFALGHWMDEKGLNNQPMLHDSLRRLIN